MAEVQISRIEFLQNNPAGDFSAGDIVDVFVETDDITVPTGAGQAGIIVYKNDVEITSGAGVFLLTLGVGYQRQNFNPIICSDSYLVNFNVNWTLFPYTFYVTEADSPSCVVNEPTCDLVILGDPVITGATGPTNADGQVSVTAVSSRTVQYKLDSDFVYNDGTGHQNTGDFTGLLPGTYRVYVRDSSNCMQNVLVTIPVDNTYGTRWKLEYNVEVDGEHVSNTRVLIQERSYSGSETEVCGGSDPVQLALRGEGEDDKFYPILSTNLNLSLISETNFQFNDLFTNDPLRFKVLYQKDFLQGNGWETYWQGFIQPQIYNEQYKAPPYEVSFVATDRLPALKDEIYAQPDGLPFEGQGSILRFIATALQKTGLQLQIFSANNIYASGMATLATSDPLDQARIDLRRFYILGKEPTYEFVLQSLLEPFGARIFQAYNRWNIVRVEELNDELEYRLYDYQGAFVSNGTESHVIDRVPPEEDGYWWINNDHNMTIKPGYGKVNVKYDMGLLPNIIEGDFHLTSQLAGSTYIPKLKEWGYTVVTPTYTVSKSFEFIDENNIALVLTGDVNTNGTAYIRFSDYTIKMGTANQLKFVIKFKVPNPIVEVPYQIVRLRVKYGTFYLGSTGKWTTLDNTMSFYVTEFGQYVEREVIADAPPGASAGLALDIRLYHSYLWYFDVGGPTELKAIATTDLPLSTRKVMNADAGLYFVGKRIIYYELEETTDAENAPYIIRPNDYNASTNPVQWVQKFSTFPTTNIVTIGGNTAMSRSFWIDKVSVVYMYNGNEVNPVIDLDKSAQPINKDIFSKTLIFGSLMQTFTTKPSFGIGAGLFGTGTGSFNLNVVNALSADVIFTGWMRTTGGIGFVNWTRDDVPESKALHLIWLDMVAAQYNRSYRTITGSLIGKEYFTFLKTLKETFDDDRLYIPMSGSFNDKQNSFTGEFVELVDIDATPQVPFNSGFTTGFGASGFN